MVSQCQFSYASVMLVDSKSTCLCIWGNSLSNLDVWGFLVLILVTWGFCVGCFAISVMFQVSVLSFWVHMAQKELLHLVVRLVSYGLIFLCCWAFASESPVG